MLRDLRYWRVLKLFPCARNPTRTRTEPLSLADSLVGILSFSGLTIQSLNNNLTELSPSFFASPSVSQVFSNTYNESYFVHTYNAPVVGPRFSERPIPNIHRVQGDFNDNFVFVSRFRVREGVKENEFDLCLLEVTTEECIICICIHVLDAYRSNNL